MRTDLYVALGILIVGLGCRGERPDGNEDKVSATLVETQVASRGAIAQVIRTSASVESESRAELIPPTSGIVVKVAKDEGDAVNKGDLLAVLNNVSLDAGATRAQDEVARLKNQRDELIKLRDRGAVSDREVEDVEYQLRSAQVSANEAIQSFGQTKITAPFDGVVAQRSVRVGEFAGSGQVAFVVVDPTSLRVVASLPERDLFRVQLGQRASLRSSYDASVEVQGEIVRMAPVVDPNTGTFRVTVGLDPDQTALRPGQFVSVSLEVSNVADALLVDRHAVGYELGQPFVYVLETPEPKDEEEASDDAEEPEADDAEEPATDEAHYVAKRRYFVAGLMDTDHVEVTEGLKEGEAFVSVGQNLLREGSLVRTSDADE